MIELETNKSKIDCLNILNQYSKYKEDTMFLKIRAKGNQFKLEYFFLPEEKYGIVGNYKIFSDTSILYNKARRIFSNPSFKSRYTPIKYMYFGDIKEIGDKTKIKLFLNPEPQLREKRVEKTLSVVGIIIISLILIFSFIKNSLPIKEFLYQQSVIFYLLFTAIIGAIFSFQQKTRLDVISSKKIIDLFEKILDTNLVSICEPKEFKAKTKQKPIGKEDRGRNKLRNGILDLLFIFVIKVVALIFLVWWLKTF